MFSRKLILLGVVTALFTLTTLLTPTLVLATYDPPVHNPEGYKFEQGSYSKANPALGYISDQYGMAIILSPKNNFKLAGIALPFWTQDNPEDSDTSVEDIYSNLRVSLYPGMARAYSDDPEVIELDNPLVSNVRPTEYEFSMEDPYSTWYAYSVFFELPKEVELDKTRNYTLTITNPGVPDTLEDGKYNRLCPNTWRTKASTGLFMRYFPHEDHGQGGALGSSVFGLPTNSNIALGLYTKDEQIAPLFHPVIFIHGMGGRPTDWDTGGGKERFKQLIKQRWEDDDPLVQYPEEWLHSLDFGLDEDGVYDYQGDVTRIAQQLDPVIENLTEQHIQAGGEGKVDLVGFSLGGIIIRRYLAVKENSGLDSKIRKAITIGTPHQGSWLMALKTGVDRFPGVENWLEEPLNEGLRSAFTHFAGENGQPLDPTSMAAQQVTPESDFLNFINQGSHTPPTVEYQTFYGDIKASLNQDLFGLNFTREVNIGDGVILKDSARIIANVPVEEHAYNDTATVNVYLVKDEASARLEIQLPKFSNIRYTHLELPKQPELQEDVTNILCQK